MPDLNEMRTAAIQKIDDAAQEALQNNQKAMENLKKAQENIALAKKLSQRAADYQDAKNALTSHTYLYRGQMQPQEMDWFWIRDRYDIIYNMYAGREAVNNYYLESTSEFKSTKLRLFADMWNVENTRENYGIGDLVLNMLHTPYIEIAGDGETAKVAWGTFSYQTELMDDGYPMGQSSAGNTGIAGVVRKEDGQWKIWVFGSGAGVEPGGDHMGGRFNATPTRLMPDEIIPGHDVGVHFVGSVPIEQKGTQFSPKAVPKNEPELPLRYETWDDSRSYIKPIAGKEAE